MAERASIDDLLRLGLSSCGRFLLPDCVRNCCEMVLAAYAPRETVAPCADEPL